MLPFIYIGVAILMFVCFTKLAVSLGYDPAWAVAIMMMLPFVNVVAFIWLCLAECPAQAKIASLEMQLSNYRDRANSQQATELGPELL